MRNMVILDFDKDKLSRIPLLDLFEIKMSDLAFHHHVKVLCKEKGWTLTEAVYIYDLADTMNFNFRG